MRKLYRSLLTRPVILLSPVPVFLMLILSTPLSWIYCGSTALALGALATLIYRPELKTKMCIQGVFFLVLCLFYYGGMLLFFPEYVAPYSQKTSSLFLAGNRPEELVLVIAAGMYWSGLFNICSSPAAEYSTAS
jgi:hypothetical protein